MRIINSMSFLYIISVLKYNLCIIIKGMLSYIYNFLFPGPKESKEEKEDDDDNYIIIQGGQYQVNEADLKSVILQPPKKEKEHEPKLCNHHISEKDLQSVILSPPKKRKEETKNDKKVNIQNLSRSQLKQIMNVKLKPTKRNEKKKIYGQRHPVLKELQEKVTKK